LVSNVGVGRRYETRIEACLMKCGSKKMDNYSQHSLNSAG
jgi:hypothetical protein